MSKVLLITYCCVLLVLQIAVVVSGTLIYVPSITSIKPCENFKNEHLNLGKLECSTDKSIEGEEKGVGLSGPLEIFKPITEEHEIALSVVKYTEMGQEPMFSAVSSICESMKDEDAPWSALFTMMNISVCPIHAASYLIDDLRMSLSFMSNALTHENCGEYKVKLEMKNKSDTKSCYECHMELEEKDVDNKQ